MDSFRSRPLVLIVDDDSTMRLLTRATLEQAGFEVAEADDGGPALEVFKSQRPDLVLLDVLMPGMDGFTTCSELRKLPEGQHTPILMATALDDLDSINRAFEVGATDFITKPINWTILSYRVRYMVRASRTFAELHRSQSRLAHAQDIARLGYWEWHLETDEFLWSEEIPRLFGIPIQENEGGLATLLHFLHPEDKDPVAQAIDVARREGRSFCLDPRIILPDSSELIVNLQVEVTLDGDGKPRQMTGTVQDINERKRAEEALRESKNFLQNVFDAIHDGICIIDQDLNVVRINKGIDRLFGSKGAPVGQKCYTFFHQGTAPCASCPALRTLETRRGQTEILPFGAAGQPHGWIEVSTYPLQDARGNISGVIAYIKDITARKRLEEQLLQSQKMEAVGRLAGGVAHDFNNMLTVITGCSDFLLNHLTGQDLLRHEVEEIQRAAQRATSLTRQLLAFSRKQMLQPQILDLNSVVASMNTMLLRIIGEDIHLVTDLEPRLGSVTADPGQIGQVILNLAVNARDAMPQGGRLTIETANVQVDGDIGGQLDIPSGFYSLLTISDTGIGIGPEAQAKIFEPFYTTKDSDKGTGLGLSTVYGIITQSGGYIRLASATGQGATFKIYLPQVAVPQLEAIVAQSQPVSLQGWETILLVEDEDLVREVTRRILERYGYTVLLAGDGHEALRLTEKYSGPLHLLLTDVIMPGMSGRQLAEHLASRHRQIKVLYMSGYMEDAIGDHGTLPPGIVFIQKPFKHFELALKVREVLSA